jgi:hypothetical protein
MIRFLTTETKMYMTNQMNNVLMTPCNKQAMQQAQQTSNAASPGS